VREPWLDFLPQAQAIVQAWEAGGSGHLLGTSAAADLAERIARALLGAYQRGKEEAARR
jgi:hypothetical protein